MSIRTLDVVDASSGDGVGVIDLAVIHDALALATRVASHATDVSAPADDRLTLRAAITDLSGALTAVCDQLLQLEAAVRSGRIAVAPVAK